MRQNNDYKYLLLKEEKLDPRKILLSENDDSNKENNALNSNIIISNTLLDSLCNQDNKELSSQKNISRQMTLNPSLNQKKRVLAFSRKNSICSTNSINSTINGNKLKENKNNNNFNFNKLKKEKNIINNSKPSQSLKQEDDTEEIIIPQNTISSRRNSCKQIISEVRELYQSNFNCFQELISTNNYMESRRKISSEPERILDAPNLSDNFFFNPLDWGSKNILSVCLGPYNYLWNYNNLETSLLSKNKNEIDYCTSNFMENGICIALGLENGDIELWDIEKKIKIRNLGGHGMRVGALAWNGYNLFSGSKDTTILGHDVRIKNNIIMKLAKGHTKEVCTIKWNQDFKYLASGGNDNLVCLWDIRGKFNQHKNSIWDVLNSQSDDESDEEDEENDININTEESTINYNPNHFNDVNLFSNNNNHIIHHHYNHKNKKDDINNNIIEPFLILNKHKGPVRALQWSPWHNNILATGGGKKDNFIRFFNADTKSVISEYNTGSPVCQILWNKYEKEIISSQGNNKNQICVWSYPKMNKIVELNGHLNRALYMAMSPDGCTIVSGSSDETLRFWNINEREKIKKKNREHNSNNALSCFHSVMCIH